MKGQMIAWNGRRGGLLLFLSIEKGVLMGKKCEFLSVPTPEGDVALHGLGFGKLFGISLINKTKQIIARKRS